MSINIQQIRVSPDTSKWLRAALESALNRDPCDALADAEALVAALTEHANVLLTSPQIKRS